MSPLLSVALLLFLLFSSPAQPAPSARVSPASPPPPPPPPSPPKAYAMIGFLPGRKRHGFRAGEAEGCMPKEFRPPPSAPSRYANYHTLGAVVCSPARRGEP
ncbi:unnamed protein product [Spirodela intermedia]|uniref:Uncharacterized protein n=2 Tax=Spirodela intermedia TaxID=51605 RepID=A0A7I8K1K4_SPIIN|nr:unnamed protein product [Spirodela intermedia]